MGFNKGPLLGFKARGVGGFRGSRDADVEVCLLQNSPKEDSVYMSFHPRNHECYGGRPYFYHVRTSACAAQARLQPCHFQYPQLLPVFFVARALNPKP